MKPKEYFKKTFVFVFVFYLVYKTVGMLFNPSEFNMMNCVKTITVSLITALVLGGINYYAKVDFFTKKTDRKPKDN
ncbi:MAG: hypothetical protein RL427_659 [Bacteroidota bacterium]|jgi:hypothetical protein